MNFLANSDAVIIDLRENRGGEPEMVQLISSYFLRGRTALNYIERPSKGETEQFWTLSHVPGKRILEADLYLLTSSKTFSAAEDFIYGLKCLRRATIIGETTKGGAHPVDFFAIQDRFVLMLPTGRTLNPISGKNWESVGIEPDVNATAEKAFDTAYKMALENLIHRTKDETRKMWLLLTLDELKARLHPIIVAEKTLQNYVGTYERSRISLENGDLYFEPEVQSKIKLIPLTETLFALEGTDSVKIRFSEDDNSDQKFINLYYKEDREMLSKRKIG
jgi:C-terminal processing protease CtpA/Prc